jgi:predicted AAA+ superfamily ATPase
MPARILAREDPELFIQKYAPPVIIDEIQYAPELLSAIKLFCDAKREVGMFWLTGSQQFKLMRGGTESLAGRAAIITLNGLSEREINGDVEDSSPFLPIAGDPKRRGKIYDEPSIFRRIFAGSYPATRSGQIVDTDLFYGSYVQTYLERDLRELSQVGNLETFFTFLRVMAARTGTTLNMSEISRDCAVSVPTVKQWISLLVATSLVHLLRPYASNRGSRLIKSPKLYFLDTGLCSYLAGYSSPETLASGPLRGAIFETWCVSEVLKSWWYAWKEPLVYYYRDKDGAEIDLLFEAEGGIYPAEIKLGAGPKKD